jgi:nitric oxide synthase oxygenase domain/subunit
VSNTLTPMDIWSMQPEIDRRRLRDFYEDDRVDKIEDINEAIFAYDEKQRQLDEMYANGEITVRVYDIIIILTLNIKESR